MPGSDSTALTARFLLLDLIERGRLNALSCPVYSSGSLVTPSAGSISIYDPSGVAVVDGAAVTIPALGSASYSWTPPSTLTYNTGWRVEWTLTVAGAVHVFGNDAALVRSRLYPVVDDADLYRRAGALQSTASDAISSITTYQSWRDEAWVAIQGRLLARGNRPNLILSPSSLREAHLTLSLALIFGDFASRNSAEYADIAAGYRSQYERAWAELTFEYAAADNDSGVNTAVVRKAAAPVFWLGGR